MAEPFPGMAEPADRSHDTNHTTTPRSVGDLAERVPDSHKQLGRHDCSSSDRLGLQDLLAEGCQRWTGHAKLMSANGKPITVSKKHAGHKGQRPRRPHGGASAEVG